MTARIQITRIRSKEFTINKETKQGGSLSLLSSWIKLLKELTWNIKTLLKEGKMMEVAKEITRYQVDVAAVQEVRWKGEGEIIKKDFTLLYLGEKKQGANGFAF
ncbi:hypothetical protein RN001_015116 [Aquatica leii]|uniref:Uncharacterized protein n=1 Tax=Aquatica leii TaxID=1421715 RepID=A0AAN7NYM4_9COLE|nr:hypothetical protein RN001_015116 [Aquatica leii]